ncbi:MAG: hypothetical protein SGPRY_005781 [Prymnesium sp.]
MGRALRLAWEAPGNRRVHDPPLLKSRINSSLPHHYPIIALMMRVECASPFLIWGWFGTRQRSPKAGGARMQIARVGACEVNLQCKLGDGGFGKVYRAKDSSEDPPVECAAKLVKIISQSDLDAVKQEVQVLQAVAGHPSVIGLRDFVETKEASRNVRQAWLFMELATGGELFERLIDAGNLTERATWPYAKALLEGIAHCHSKGVIHRDVKLENIMLCAEDPNAIKLIDFGLATFTGLTPEGTPKDVLLYETVGTKSYRPPEVSNSARSGYLGPPVDVWSLGAPSIRSCQECTAPRAQPL